mmetsp:Transcript_33157/g.104889  ORF Transcript_33157/g.104889 Transcript_33157/m.104889 type:complete len:398 (+) Transcript_33157:209-1402(+)
MNSLPSLLRRSLGVRLGVAEAGLGDNDGATLLHGGLERLGEGRLPAQAERLEELAVRVELRVGRGEQLVAVEDGVGAGHEEHGLLGVAHLEAAGAEAHDGTRHGDARGSDGAGHVPDRRHVSHARVGQRRAVHGHERVDGHGLGVLRQRRERVDEANAVHGLLPEPENAAGAHGDAGVAHVLDGLQAVLVAARRDYLGVVLGRCVEVVVVGREARILELTRLLRREHAQRGAALHAHLLHAGDHGQDVLEGVLLPAELAPRGAHAEARGAGLLRAARRREHLVHLHLRRGLDEGLVLHGLRAVAAVLRAAARLDGDERALLHLARVEEHAVHARRLEYEVQQRPVVDLRDLFPRPAVAYLHSLASRDPPLLALHLHVHRLVVHIHLRAAIRKGGGGD